MKKIDKNANMFNLDIFSRSNNYLLKILKKHLSDSDQLYVIFTPNPEQVMLAKQDKQFASYLGFADILVPDGVGLIIASKLLAFFSSRNALTERITGIDLAQSILSIAKNKKQSVLLLGGKDYAFKAKAKKQESYPSNLTVNGQSIYWTPAYENISQPTQEEEAAVVQIISDLKPDIVFVAFGAPYQEKWIYDHCSLLTENKVKIAMVVGGAFDMMLGKVKRAPKVIRSLGMEWLYRLAQEPWRARRQFKLIGFIGLTLKSLFFTQGNK